MDALNKAIYQFLSADEGVIALVGDDALNGGVWDLDVDDEASLPYYKFNLASGPRPYHGFGGINAWRCVYFVQGYAEQTATQTGRELASLLSEAAASALEDAELEIEGYELLVCQIIDGIPPLKDEQAAERSTDTFSQGVMVEIIYTRAS